MVALGRCSAAAPRKLCTRFPLFVRHVLIVLILMYFDVYRILQDASRLKRTLFELKIRLSGIKRRHRISCYGRCFNFAMHNVYE